MQSHDDPKDVEQNVKQPAVNTWTENDTPPDGLKRGKKSKTKLEKDDPKTLHDVEHRGAPGTGEPDAEETYRRGTRRN